MKLDFYLKFILSVIAVGLLGLNIYFFKPVLVNNAFANQVKVIPVLTAKNQTIFLVSDNGQYACEFPTTRIYKDKWTPTGC